MKGNRTNLPVLEGIPEELHLPLVGKGAAVSLQATGNFVLLLCAQEVGGVWVIIHHEERSEGDSNGNNALDDELRTCKLSSRWSGCGLTIHAQLSRT